MEGAEPDHRACRRSDFVIVTLGCFLLRLPSLLSRGVIQPDEEAIAVQASTLVRGGRLYIDIADRKPPVPPLVYAAWFHLTSSNDLRPMRFTVSAMLAVAAVVLMRDVCRTHGRTAALWAAALYVGGAFALAPEDATPANYAQFALPLATIALVWCRRGGWWPAWGGLMLGFAILSRQSWIFAVPAGAYSVWRAGRVRGLTMYLVATTAGVASAAVFVPWHEFWFWVFQSSPGFVFASLGLGTAFARGAGALAMFLACHLLLVFGAGSTLPESLRRHPDLWLWTLTGLAAASAGFRFYGHYWLQLLPPLVLLAAPAIASWTSRQQRVGVGVVGLTSLVMFVSVFVSSWFIERPDAEKMAVWIRGCTTADDRMFVWGAFPQLLYAADRPAAGGLVHSDFVTGRSGGRSRGTDAVTPGAQEKMMTNLRAAPPALMVDTSGVDRLGYTAFPMSGNRELAAFATAGYTPQKVRDGFVVWWRKDHPPCPAPASGG